MMTVEIPDWALRAVGIPLAVFGYVLVARWAARYFKWLASTIPPRDEAGETGFGAVAGAFWPISLSLRLVYLLIISPIIPRD